MSRQPTEDDIRRIYRETIDDLYAFVSRRCDGRRDLAEDMVQEAWLRAVRAWRDDGIPDKPIAWLATVASRLLSNHFRRPAMATLDEASLAELGIDEADAALDDARESLVVRALARLPIPQMRLLQAFHYERRPVAEIASSSGLSERAVEGRLRRARLNLRKHIEADRSADGE